MAVAASIRASAVTESPTRQSCGPPAAASRPSQRQFSPRQPSNTRKRMRMTAQAAASAAGSVAFTAEAAGPTPPPAGRTVLFTHTLCPYAERVWIALLEKGIPFRLVHIDLSNKPAWYRAITPRGLVPALQHNGQVHLESADICRWIDGAFEGPGLVPTDPSLKNEMEQLLGGACSGVVSAGLDLMAGRTGRYWGIGSGQTAAQRAAFESQLRKLEALLQQHGGPFLLGAHPCLADINVYPFLKRYDVGMRELCGYDVSEALGGSIGAWLAAMDARPSCSVTAADNGLLLRAYKKHMCLDFFDYDTYSCFQLHPHNSHLLQR